ncbi:sensor histidine kinase [Fulvimarina sp. MAC3]|uniref:sensor histidine kinase n=1 Tax=Fulvimarina sp. MAC3 TaxID=3148887 RepID=UPI0031FCA360
MSLTIKLAIRLMAVAFVALGVALSVVAVDTSRAIENDIASTQARVSYQLERMHRGGNGYPIENILKLTSIDIVLVMTPGTCVLFTQVNNPDMSRRLCAGWNIFGEIPPAWFRKGVGKVLGPFDPVIGEVPIYGRDGYRLKTFYDPVAAATRVWQQARILTGLAAGLSAAIAILSIIAVAHALRPVGSIVLGLDALKDGALKTRIARSGTREFDQIAAAVDALAKRLELSLDDRRMLMKRLFAVQEDERRNLARDLHDEFGQCLTAALALTSSIEGNASKDRPDIARDAATLAKIERRMMETLKGAFSRLRPPDLAEIGLRASLHALVHEWNSSLSGRTRVTIEAPKELDETPSEIAVAIYRIVQECLTNVARHANASEARVSIRFPRAAPEPSIEVTVVDDGVGCESANDMVGGSGLIGMRERVSALGGRLSVVTTGGGTHIAALIPQGAPFAEAAE